MTEAPSCGHWLGTDQFGRDMLSRIIYGARTALIVGFGSAVVGGIIGLVLGVASAYFGGWRRPARGPRSRRRRPKKTKPMIRAVRAPWHDARRGVPADWSVGGQWAALGGSVMAAKSLAVGL